MDEGEKKRSHEYREIIIVKAKPVRKDKKWLKGGERSNTYFKNKQKNWSFQPTPWLSSAVEVNSTSLESTSTADESHSVDWKLLFSFVYSF